MDLRFNIRIKQLEERIKSEKQLYENLKVRKLEASSLGNEKDLLMRMERQNSFIFGLETALDIINGNSIV